MSAKRPEVLLFDLGRVLVENVMFDELPAFFPEPIGQGELRRRWLLSPSVQAFERGQTTTDEFLTCFIAEWGLRASPTQFLEAFTCWPRGPYPGALELLDQLRETHQIALLTNCNAVHWDRIAPLRRRVHVAFSSHLLGLVKPDAAIFKCVIGELQVAAANVWFFDDSLANVEAARTVGMHAVQTEGIDALREALRDCTA